MTVRLDPAEVRAALRTVLDPELGLDIVELGLVYGIETAPGTVRVRLTMTTPSCPLAGLLADQARAALRALAPDLDLAEVELVWDPPWHAGLMSAQARASLGW